jgi:hypothetical protein
MSRHATTGIIARRGFAMTVAALAALCGVTFLQSGALADRAADQTSAREYLVKAAFIFNFAKFTEWPADAFADAASPLRVCVLDQDPFGDVLKAIEGRNIGDRKIAIARMSRMQNVGHCHLLFTGRSERERLAQILDDIGDHPVLTVTDAPKFASDAGIINFKVVGGKVRFAINLGAAERARLKLSSRLLSLAEITESAAIHKVSFGPAP